MRVITGIAKGRRLKALKGMDTRPTSDRIKEALFSILSAVIIDKKFLDLFAGTGAIGIEAISRGADRSVFVEQNPQAIKVIKANLELTGLTDQAEIICSAAEKAVELLAQQRQKFDIIFLDPPYRKNLIEKALIKIDNMNILLPGGLIVTESSKLEILPEQVGLFRLYRQEKYGDTVLSFYQET